MGGLGSFCGVIRGYANWRIAEKGLESIPDTPCRNRKLAEKYGRRVSTSGAISITLNLTEIFRSLNKFREMLIETTVASDQMARPRVLQYQVIWVTHDMLASRVI